MNRRTDTGGSISIRSRCSGLEGSPGCRFKEGRKASGCPSTVSQIAQEPVLVRSAAFGAPNRSNRRWPTARSKRRHWMQQGIACPRHAGCSFLAYAKFSLVPAGCRCCLYRHRQGTDEESGDDSHRLKNPWWREDRPNIGHPSHRRRQMLCYDLHHNLQAALRFSAQGASFNYRLTRKERRIPKTRSIPWLPPATAGILLRATHADWPVVAIGSTAHASRLCI